MLSKFMYLNSFLFEIYDRVRQIELRNFGCEDKVRNIVVTNFSLRNLHLQVRILPYDPQ